jgi:hypothetical protein
VSKSGQNEHLDQHIVHTAMLLTAARHTSQSTIQSTATHNPPPQPQAPPPPITQAPHRPQPPPHTNQAAQYTPSEAPHCHPPPPHHPKHTHRHPPPQAHSPPPTPAPSATLPPTTKAPHRFLQVKGRLRPMGECGMRHLQPSHHHCTDSSTNCSLCVWKHAVRLS